MKCHGNLNSGKMSHLQGQTLFLEDIAVDTFVHSSFGTIVMTLFQGFFSTPSWRTFTYLACGWAFASDRHTITTYMWLTGASAVKHFSRFYVFLGVSPLQQTLAPLGGGYPPGSPVVSQRARSFGSASTIPPRKKPVPISKDSPATVMAPAPHGKNTGRCGA